MKKIFYILLSSLLMVSMYSCGDNDDDGGDPTQNLQIVTRLKTGSGTFSHPGAIVYVFMDIDNRSNEYTYTKGGLLVRVCLYSPIFPFL